MDCLSTSKSGLTDEKQLLIYIKSCLVFPKDFGLLVIPSTTDDKLIVFLDYFILLASPVNMVTRLDCIF